MHDVLIVGAGLAGLSCADRLIEQGWSVRVLEARDRVGGRIHTQRYDDGVWLDLGGQWLGPGQDHMYALARRFEKSTWPMYVEGRHLLHLEGRHVGYSGQIPLGLGAWTLANLGWVIMRLEYMARRVPLDKPWRAKRAESLDHQTLGDWMRRNIRCQRSFFITQAVLEGVLAVHPDDVSLLHALFYLHAGGGLENLASSAGGAQQDRVDGGTQPIATALADSIADRGGELLLEHPVERITRTEDNVSVTVSNGETLQARSIVVAIPPALAADITYEPERPSTLTDWQEHSPPGRAIKCFAVYREPFWRHQGFSGSAVGDTAPLHVVFDGTPPDADHGILVGFIEGREADYWLEQSESERQKAVLRCLEQFFGPRARDALWYTDQSWVGETWSRGCYAGMCHPGAWTRNRVDPTEPQGRLFWAGTETAREWTGYMEGAVRSGLRAADQVNSRLAHEPPPHG